MAFSTTYEERNVLTPEGEYECIIHSAHVTASRTDSGRAIVYFSVQLTVRNDVPQTYQNKHIYHAIWQKREENQSDQDRAMGGFSFKQVMNLCKAAGIPSGSEYDTLDDLGRDLCGRIVRANLIHDTYNGKTSEKIKWFTETKYPQCRHQQRSTAVAQAASPAQPMQEFTTDISIGDEDLPF